MSEKSPTFPSTKRYMQCSWIGNTSAGFWIKCGLE
jgi:hypothetical protein